MPGELGGEEFAMDILTVGNTAKLYCLDWIEKIVLEKGEPLSILDLGCGASAHFVRLLNKYPHIKYVGVEPRERSCEKARRNLADLNATIYCMKARRVYETVKEKFDIVVSFSVLEQVYRRHVYLRQAKQCLKENGYFLINCDSGHFTSGDERPKNLLGPVLARFGIERYYQSFISDEAFRQMAEQAGFKILEAGFFNTNLKTVYKMVPAGRRDEFMEKWLQLELWLNGIGIEWDDSMIHHFASRNFILTHA